MERQEEINGFFKSATAREIINIKFLTILKIIFRHPSAILVSKFHLRVKKAMCCILISSSWLFSFKILPLAFMWNIKLT